MIRFMEGILLRKAAEDVARVLSGAGHTVYFVGGCVRDRLLGYSVKDIDIATSARPDEVLRLFPDAWEVGAAFGVVLVRHGPGQGHPSSPVSIPSLYSQIPCSTINALQLLSSCSK